MPMKPLDVRFACPIDSTIGEGTSNHVYLAEHAGAKFALKLFKARRLHLDQIPKRERRCHENVLSTRFFYTQSRVQRPFLKLEHEEGLRVRRLGLN
jgi:hypothetical protein